ncbi:MAG: prolipoprotein diacylglyceryl transferase [Candidatus Binatia bacterium]
MYPEIVSIGPVTIYSYGVMMALGFLAAGWTTGKELVRQGKDPAFASTLVLWAAVGGLVGARVLFIVEQWREFVVDPLSLIFTGAGFTWYGGLIGGVVGVTLCIRRYGFSWIEIMDAIAPGIALGHGIGRIGCHLAGDGDWGPPTDLPWGVAYTNAIVGWPPPGQPPDVRVHPSALYEAIAYVLIFALLWSQRAKPRPVGSLFWGYLLLSGLARFLIEFLRINPPLILGLSEAQIISIGLMVVGAVMLTKRDLSREPARPVGGTPRIAREK